MCTDILPCMRSTPRVGFDALFLEQPMTGAGQYAQQLWSHLLQQRHQIDPLLCMPADAPERVLQLAPPEQTVAIRPPRAAMPRRVRKIWWEQRGLPAATLEARPSLVHVPYWSAPLSQTVPHIVTIHDVIPLMLPAYGGSLQMRLYLRGTISATKRARLILTDSAYSRDDIVRRLRIPAERIRVIPLAVGSLFSTDLPHDEAQQRVQQRFGISGPFVLNVGGLDVRKRIPQVLEAFAQVLPQLPADMRLVIVGRAHTGNPRMYPDITGRISALGLTSRVHLTGFVSEEEKRDLYRAAQQFVFASEYEGFGLTPLEAMACGLPTISSNRSSLPEVVGDGGLQVTPEPDDLAAAMLRLANDSALRSDLARRGVQQAARFTWERTAAQTLSAYHEVLETARH